MAPVRDGAPKRAIAFIGGTSEPGGLHVHTAEVAQACAALGHQVTIFCPSINHYEGLVADSRVVVECIPALGDGRWYQQLSRWNRTRSGRSKRDIVFCNGNFAETRLFDLAIAATVARKVFTIDHRPWEGPWRSRIPKVAYGRFSSRLIHRSIAVSSEISHAAETEFSFPRRKVATCLNWVHPLFRPPTFADSAKAVTADRETEKVFKIGYLGRLAPEKRIDHLLRSFALLASRGRRPIELSIVGDGWKRPELTALAEKLNIRGLVRFAGWSASPWDILRDLDAFVLPSLIEGFPLALMEAMAVGCACIAHPMSSTRELIGQFGCGILVDMNTVDGLAVAIDELMAKGPEFRVQMGTAAAARIASEFSRDRRLPDVLKALEIDASGLPPAASRVLTFVRPVDG